MTPCMYFFLLPTAKETGGGGYSLIEATEVCAALSGRVFASFWSENGYTVYPFWSGIRYGFRGNYGGRHECKKERKI